MRKAYLYCSGITKSRRFRGFAGTARTLLRRRLIVCFMAPVLGSFPMTASLTFSKATRILVQYSSTVYLQCGGYNCPGSSWFPALLRFTLATTLAHPHLNARSIASVVVVVDARDNFVRLHRHVNSGEAAVLLLVAAVEQKSSVLTALVEDVPVTAVRNFRSIA